LDLESNPFLGVVDEVEVDEDDGVDVDERVVLVVVVVIVVVDCIEVTDESGSCSAGFLDGSGVVFAGAVNVVATFKIQNSFI